MPASSPRPTSPSDEGMLRGSAEPRAYDVAGLGNALVDALVRMDDVEFLKAHGITRGHMTPVDHERWQAVFHEIQVHGVEIHSGGSCANTVASLGFLGAKGIYCGNVGDDQLGHLYSRRMEEACGEHALIWTREGNTGKCLSIISSVDAERTMLTDLGAAVHMHDLGRFRDIIPNSRLLHVTGYLMLGEPMRSRAHEAMAIAAQHELPISLDVADPFVVGVVKDEMWHAIEEFANIVFLNEEEARTLTGEADPEAALARVARVCDTVVVKLGRRGSLVQHRGRRAQVGVHAAQAIDTTGAGDSYAAGFLYGYLNGWSPARAADLGARVAAMAVGQIGAVVRDRDRMRAAAVAAGA